MKLLLLNGGAEATRTRTAEQGRARTETGDAGVAAVVADGRCVLVNVSSAVAQQLERGVPALGEACLGDPEVRAVVLTDAQLEHVGGLLSLRRGAPIDLYATPAVFDELSTNMPVLPAMQHYCGVHWRVIPVAGDQRVASFAVEGLPSVEFIAIATEAAPWPHAAQHRAPAVGDSIALVVRDRATGATAYCSPGSALPTAEELTWMRSSDAVLLANSVAGDLSGSGGDDASAWAEQAIRFVHELPARHKVVLGASADASRQRWRKRGFELAHDGMELEL